MLLEIGAVGAGLLYLAINSLSNEALIKRQWNSLMQAASGDGVRNKQGQSYQILKIIKKQYGFDSIIGFPPGLSFEKLETLVPAVETNFGCVTELEWKRFEHCAYLKAATTEYDETKPFQPVKTSGPWELFCGETYFLEELKADMRDYPHILTAGSTGSGKSCCIFIIVTNLLYWYDNVDLYMAMTSDKKDLQKFCHYKQCQYFAQNFQTTDQLIKYLLNLQHDRNKELNRYGLNNISEYNKKFPGRAIKYSYLVIDEFASLMPGESEKVDPYYTIKKRIIYNLHELLRQARSAGIFVITSLQRPDKTNLDPNIKNLLNIKIAFRANNLASSKVLTDDDSAYNLPNREALFMGSYQKTLKTPYIDDKLIRELLKDKYESNHKYINIHPEEPKPISPNTSDKPSDKQIDKKKRREFKL